MSSKLVFYVLILSVAAMARPEAPEGKLATPKGSHELTLFGSSVGAKGQKEFEKVFGNKDLTIAEMDTQLAVLAEKYGVLDEFKQFQANSANNLEEVKKQQKELIEKLYSVSAKLDSIYDDKDQTLAQQEEAVQAVVKSNQKLIPFISSSETERKIRLTLTCTISF